MQVGTDRTLYFLAVSGASSMSSLPTLILPAKSSAILSTIGDKALQGPHYDAAKCTSTGNGDRNTSASKSGSVKVLRFALAIAIPFDIG